MTTLRARYVFPVDRPPIENGVVGFKGEHIVEVGQFQGQTDAIDLGDVAIIPGLVNAHTHLEFSDLKRPLGQPGMSLPRWIRAVIEHRDQSLQPGDTYRTDARDPAETGLQESARCGVTMIGEIAQVVGLHPGIPLDLTVFQELRAPRAYEIPMAMHFAESVAEYPSSEYRSGLSPHAPYTVHWELLEAVVALSAEHELPVAMHLAESLQELEFLRNESGEFRELLEDRGAWEPAAALPQSKPLDYLQRLNKAHRSLVVHGNYLDEEEIDFLAAHRGQMSVVYCPRTHAYFEHQHYALGKMLERGVRVALGTDSRASNPDLDLRKEMQFVVNDHFISPERALRLGTVEGVEALGLGDIAGTITAGKLANLAVMQIPNRTPADLHELLLDASARATVTICRGCMVFTGGNS
jgi:cytosine/adenosine deaminase-related metal-dependent hydrolase